MVELDPPRGPSSATTGASGSGDCSATSRNSNTRSAEAIPDCRMLAIEASWVRGWVNCRAYWMNAWMSPMVI